MEDTIAAIATPAGTGGIAVIRVSGPQAVEVASRIWRGRDLRGVASHTAHYGTVVGDDGSELDGGLATVFRAPRSYTGEDTVELSIHGSRWLQQRVLELLCRHGARAAGPGEFTQRAFVNGRLDLAQAEAVADIIAADSAAAHRLAVTQMSGEFSRRLGELRDQLVELASLVELELDFSEEDVEFADRGRLSLIAGETLAAIDRLTASYRAGRAIKEGVTVVLAGAPNAGKSTLLNALLGEEKAIVTDIPGTTRDTIEDTVEIEGILFRLTDTAGLRDTDDPVEAKGIERTRCALARAAIVLWLEAPVGEGSADEGRQQHSRPGDLLTDLDLAAAPMATHIRVRTKSDLSAGRGRVGDTPGAVGGSAARLSVSAVTGEGLSVSAVTGEGLDDLRHLLADTVRGWGVGEDQLVLTNRRHHDELQRGAEALRRVAEGLRDGVPGDLLAQDLRQATGAISAVTGSITTDDLLSTIFSRFCIGK